jgi:hypothetical protein
MLALAADFTAGLAGAVCFVSVDFGAVFVAWLAAAVEASATAATSAMSVFFTVPPARTSPQRGLRAGLPLLRGPVVQ